jgi:isoleucyl-tRNA synthetase
MSGAAAPAHGHLHVGQVLEDMEVKARNMSGRRRELLPGEDSHGLPRGQGVEHAWVYVALTAGPEVARRLPALAGQQVAFVTGTTTPWALLTSRALAVHPDYEYLFYRLGEQVVCVAKERLAKVLAEVKADELALRTVKLPGGEVQAAALVDPRRIVGYALGEELEGLRYRHLFSGREGRVVLGSHVTQEAGTGLVPMEPGQELPERVLQEYGAEVLRLWVASSGSRLEALLSEQSLEGLAEGYRKLRDTLHSALGNLYDFNPAEHAVPTAELLPLDAWARGRLGEVVARVRQAYDSKEFHRVYAILVDFCAGDLLAVYFDMLKDRLYLGKATGPGRRSAQTVLYEVAKVLMQLLAPMVGSTAEEAWQHLPGRPAESVFLTDFPEPWGLEAGLAELPSLLGVSQVELVEAAGDRAQVLEVRQTLGEVKAEVLPARGARCPRCGTYAEEVERGAEVCPKCQEALERT